MLAPWKKSYCKPRQHIKKQRHHFAENVQLYHQSYSFSSSYVWMSEKAMAPYSSTLAWKTPWMEEPGRLQSMGSLGVGHNWATSLSLFNFMHWRRKWHSTPVLLPGKSHRWRRLVGCSPWGREESDITERLPFQFSLSCIGEGNGNPLQCSCLENPRDRGAWWAAVYGVAQSWTWLKRRSSSSSSNMYLLILNSYHFLIFPL